MSWFGNFITSSLGKKFVMSITGLFLILFLAVHCGVNSLIFLNDGGVTFNKAAHFMGTNIIIRTMEIGLFLGFFLHIIQALLIAAKNRSARPIRYQVNSPSQNSTWYSRSMTLLGTLILLFLIIHIKHFWWVSRITGLEETADGTGDLFIEMTAVFQHGWIVIVYLLGVTSLLWHLIHGFRSAFHTLGLTRLKYTKLITNIGIAYSIIVSILFAMMPVTMFFGWIQ
ncbi:MAG: succinate dehydrogenase cytochrome b subunit [Bacteroidetes bacterium]|nr:succinate dehydrogenase cytochrome b subunit [Bacteroidota bacterium]MBP7398852.1 succinate dehydrogenase cytochrome b subunit [Chitinophagales bacterium]MBK7109474.1 succinate dehydrogenase cytochrome b subunit [Bacteroidota bacterium]MBK8682458.1 succinate dehydrogenase cytochrome b subunit [Bacteroidota bacterium]MBP8754772.1 succinate dehydrogenase cytochrome b subunit [Chitinophagales bacterium]